MYHERWIPSGSKWALERAYLHLYRAETGMEETEMLCLHCDPDEPPGAPWWTYKRGPHLHFSEAPEPIPHSHVALGLANLTEVLRTHGNLMEMMKHAIDMIRDEILDRLPKR